MMTLTQNKKAKTLTYHLKDNLINIDEITFFLKKQLQNADMARVCIHQDNENLTHTMIIAITKDYKMKLHKNPTKNKIYMIVEGEMEFEIENKKLIAKKGDIINIEKNSFMKQTSISDIAIYQEIIAGPFKNDTIYKGE